MKIVKTAHTAHTKAQKLSVFCITKLFLQNSELFRSIDQDLKNETQQELRKNASNRTNRFNDE